MFLNITVTCYFKGLSWRWRTIYWNDTYQSVVYHRK